MKTQDLFEYLNGNEYPGRGIVVGRTPCGRKMRIAYWIMGRSENSRNRIFVEEGQGIRTQAFDPAKLENPSLIIYAPVRVLGDTTVVTNGDQTDTIYDFLKEGKTFEEALRTRTFEPDGPNWTPRISVVLHGAAYTMSILKSANLEGTSVHRYFFDYTEEEPGVGHLITTYRENGNPIPSFEGEPVRIAMEHQKFEEWSEAIWNALNLDNKVSLFTRQISLEDGTVDTKIFNKNH